MREIVIIGSQAMLGECLFVPAEALRSAEADCFPLVNSSLADLIDGAIRELSPFHAQFGYYARGVSPDTAILPAGWKDRLVRIENENTGGAVRWCLSAADLVASKLAAGREKYIQFIEALLCHNCVALPDIERLIDHLPKCRDQARERLCHILKRIRARPSQGGD